MGYVIGHAGFLKGRECGYSRKIKGVFDRQNRSGFSIKTARIFRRYPFVVTWVASGWRDSLILVDCPAGLLKSGTRVRQKKLFLRHIFFPSRGGSIDCQKLSDISIKNSCNYRSPDFGASNFITKQFIIKIIILNHVSDICPRFFSIES